MSTFPLLPAEPSALPSPLPPSALDRLAAAWLLSYGPATRNAYTGDLRAWCSWCRDRDIDPLTVGRAYVDAWTRQLSEIDHLAPATVARRLAALSSFYKYAVDEGVLARSPVRGRRPRVANLSQGTGLTRQEVSALLVAAEKDSPRSHAALSLLAFCGLRISEALGADVDDLGHERGHRTLGITRKGGATQTIPLPPRVAEAIDSYLAGRTTGPLFATRTGARMSRVQAWRDVRRLAGSAGLDCADSLHPHDLRHTFVTLALNADASLRDVQDAAGHQDPRTTRRYDRARGQLDRHPGAVLAALID